MRKAEDRKTPGEMLTFHGWTRKNEVMFAIVEYSDGRIEEVEPTQLKFSDQVKKND